MGFVKVFYLGPVMKQRLSGAVFHVAKLLAEMQHELNAEFANCCDCAVSWNGFLDYNYQCVQLVGGNLPGRTPTVWKNHKGRCWQKKKPWTIILIWWFKLPVKPISAAFFLDDLLWLCCESFNTTVEFSPLRKEFLSFPFYFCKWFSLSRIHLLSIFSTTTADAASKTL